MRSEKQALRLQRKVWRYLRLELSKNFLPDISTPYRGTKSVSRFEEEFIFYKLIAFEYSDIVLILVFYCFGFHF